MKTGGRLSLRGPGKVGKTESVRHFGQANYREVIYINFVKNRNIK